MKPQDIGVTNALGVQAPGVIDVREILSISPAEATARAREENLRMSAAHRIPDQDVLEDHKAARGQVMESHELIRRIQLINPKILVQKGGVKGAVALYYPTRQEFGKQEYEYISGFYLEPLPEFSSVTTDVYGRPHREVRGWRSVLTAFMNRGILDRKKVDAMFGPATGQRAGLWYRNLQAQSKNI